MSWLVLFSQAAQRDDPFRKPEVIWGTAGMAVALLAGALAIWLVDRWRKKAEREGDRTVGELTDFRGMYERGEITEEEYARLRDKVASRVKVEKAPPPSAAAPPGGTAPPQPPPPTPPGGEPGGGPGPPV
jgi:hypothetical protein